MKITTLKLFINSKWEWTESLSDYSAADYTLQFVFKYQTLSPLIVNSAVNADGSSFDLAVTAAANSALTPGSHLWQARIISIADPTDITLYETGVINIYPDLATATDGRTYWQTIADEAKAAYKILINQVAESITLSNGKTINYANRMELLKIINHAEIKGGIKSGKTRTFAKFINP